MPYLSIQLGTGNVGKHALRNIAERPGFELVGVRVYNPDKVGRDAGELLGPEPLGVRVTPGLHLQGAGENAAARLAAACEEGGSSFFHVGINPGFAMDLWPITLSRVCRRIDKITATEVVDMTRYASIHMVRDAIGFGVPPDQQVPVDAHNQEVYESAYYLAMRMLADAIGIDLDEVKYHREVATTDRDIEIAAGTIEAGTVAAMKFVFDGMVDDRPVISLQLVWRVSDEVAPEWPTGDSRWLVHIDGGNPVVDSELVMATEEDAGRAVSLSVATLLLNAVPTVVEAPPRLLDNLTLPLHGGGYVERRAPAELTADRRERLRSCRPNDRRGARRSRSGSSRAAPSRDPTRPRTTRRPRA